MKKKIFTRPVCIMVSQEMHEDVAQITDQLEIGISDYFREALQDKLANEKETLLSGAFPVSWFQISQNLSVEPEKLIRVYQETRETGCMFEYLRPFPPYG